MDFNLIQWRDKSEEEEQQQPQTFLPFFVPQTTPSPRMGSYFSLEQWQELELQALIFKHIISGASVPPQLIFLLNKTLINPATSPYYYNYQTAALVQWGRNGMDPEPGRCRRTDGKKWRCSRDVVVGQKYCERHMHRGRNRSRKPVEMPTTAAIAAGGGESVRSSQASQFSISGNLSAIDPRSLDSITRKRSPNDGESTLRHFLQDNHDTNSMAFATNLSISMPGNPSSDFSLKLGMGGHGDDSSQVAASSERERRQLNWGTLWGEANRGAATMGGPLAEALRMSMTTSSSSPTSVLHRIQPRNMVSEASL